MHSAKHKQGGASTYGKMSVLRQGRCLWHSGVSLPQAFQPYLEAQCEARQGDRGRKSQARLRMHSLPAQRQGHPRCVIFLLPETSSPKGELFSLSCDRADFRSCCVEARGKYGVCPTNFALPERKSSLSYCIIGKSGI